MKVKLGDIFSIKLPEEVDLYLGQVIYVKSKKISLVVFDCSNLEDLREETKIILFANTFDVYFQNEKWLIVTNLEPINFSFPNYKIETNKGLKKTDFHGNITIELLPHEAVNYDFKMDVSPIVVEKALRAYGGYIPAEERFNSLYV